MQEVLELQQQHQGTVHHVEVVKQRLQNAERRQRQMLSFLAKLFQNPAFLARLKEKKDQEDAGSSRMRKKFIKHQQSEPSSERQIVKYITNWSNLAMSSPALDSSKFSVALSPDKFMQGTVGMDLGSEQIPFQVKDIPSEELTVPDELVLTQGSIETLDQFGEGLSSFGREDPHSKGKKVASPQQETYLDYFISFPEDLVEKKTTPEFPSVGTESIAKLDDGWSIGFNASLGMSNSSEELWSNLENYNLPELGTTSGFPDNWYLGPEQAAEGSGCADESTLDEPDSQAG